MTVTIDERVAELEQQLEHERRLTREVSAARWFDRFHAFDAIKNDSCPSCGGRVKVVDEPDPNGLSLVAFGREEVDELLAEYREFRAGVEEALRQMQAGRRTVAISTLKAVLSGETW